MVGFIWTPPVASGANEIHLPFIAAETVVYPPEVRDGAIFLPFIAADTDVFPPTIADSGFRRFSQIAVEAVVEPDPLGRFGQIAVEAVILPNRFARFSQIAAEAVVLPNRAARFSHVPIEVVGRSTYETFHIFIID